MKPHILPTSALLVTAFAVRTATAGALDLAAAIAAAADGDVITVPAGVYAGSIVIDRSIMLDGGGEAVIDGGGERDVVRITAPDVTFRGFTVRNSGMQIDGENSGILVLGPRTIVQDNLVEDCLFGISLKNAPEGVVRNNTIRGKNLDIARRGDGIRVWQSGRTIIEDNMVTDSRDVVMWFSDGMTLRRNHVSRSRYGMHFMYTHDNVLEDNHLEDNSVGAFLMYSRNLVVRRNVFARNRGPSGYGLGLKDMQGVLVEDNVVAGNRVGLYFDSPPVMGGPFDIISRNAIAKNDIGLAFQPAVRQMAFTDNTFIENVQQVAILGGGDFKGNRFTVDGRGNYWSDYRGYDINGDGIGDMRYDADSLFENLMEREPSLRLFMYSPAQQAIELAARAFPIMKPEPRVSDESPLMQPAPMRIRPSQSASNPAMWLSGTGLLGLALLSLTAGRPQFARRMGAPS
jgi:nitrous oxidase accessory protein